MPIDRRHFLLSSSAALLAADPAGRIPVVIQGREVASFYFGDEWDKPFVYPIRTVSGRAISRGYPVEKIAGEQTDHIWHRGLWYGHGIINGRDFWREQGRDKTSRLVIKGVPTLRKSKGQPVVSAEMSMQTPTGTSLGLMRQEWRFQDRGSLRFIDILISIHANQGQPLVFGDTDDGGFAFRLNDSFRQDRGAKLRNSSGLETTEKIWGKAAHWVDYSATLDGLPTGVAIFDHPSNLRYPTAWHARGYSLCAANPFAAKSFSKGKDPDGSYTLAVGQELVLRYRVVIHEGPFEPPVIEKLHRQWAKC
jgi:hypothetical protein